MISYECQGAQIKLRDSGTLSSWLAAESLDPSQVHNRNPPLYDALPSSSSRPTARIETDSMTEEMVPCPGAFVDYGRSVFSHYRMHLHDVEGLLDHDFSYIDPRGRSFRVKSSKCSGKSFAQGVACAACNQVVIGRQFQDLVKRADPNSPVPPTLAHQYRTQAQLCESLKEKASEINNLKLKELSLQRRIQTLSNRLDDQKALTLALFASDDVIASRKRKYGTQNDPSTHQREA